MNILADEKNYKLQHMLGSSFFEQLFSFIQEGNQAPTLREIKAKMAYPKMEKALDLLIEEQIILRENKRYYLNLTAINQSENESLIIDEVLRINEQLNGFTMEQQMQIIAKWYQSIDFETAILVPQDVPFLFIDSVETDLIKILSFASSRRSQSLPNYFKAQRQKIHWADYNAFNRLLGDLDPTYFLDQVFMIVEQISQEKRVRPSIFLTALEWFGIVAFDKQWAVTIPMVKKEISIKSPSTSESYERMTAVDQSIVLTKVVNQLKLFDKTIIIYK